ncbi:MAG: ATP-binding protein [Candidatus Thorarchaeota archaeon]
MISHFVNRTRQLAVLDEEWSRRGPRFIVLYGRRRIGKTRLLVEFFRDKSGVFYVADDTPARLQTRRFREKMAQYLNDPLLARLEIKDWGELFEYLSDRLPRKRFYIAIDEFPYLLKNDMSILSQMQRWWDESLSRSSVFLVLCGSMLGLMSESVLSYASPLYGRRTRDLLLEPLRFEDARQFVKYPFEDALKLYLTVGGVPEYLLRASEYSGIMDFLRREFFDKMGYFYREPFYMVSQDLRELRTYFAILDAIARGNTRPTRIGNYVGIEGRSIYPYLQALSRLGLVERETPLLGDSRRGVYVIRDSMFAFWFSLVYANRQAIEQESFELSEDLLTPYYGHTFERFVRREFFPRLGHTMVGRWWHRGEEIDIVSVDEKEAKLVLVECKWSRLTKSEAHSVIARLQHNAEKISWRRGSRRELYGVVARRVLGKNELRRNGYLVYDLRDIRSVFEAV